MEAQHYGFGLPINQSKRESIHWFNSRGEPICGNGLHFLGDKFPDLTPEMAKIGACFSCVASLLDPLDKLGKPDGFPDRIVVRIPKKA